MSEIFRISEPSRPTGDSVTSISCSDGNSCNSSSDDCSGGYACPEEESDSSGEYSWPKDRPLPDDKNKIPKRCGLPTKNTGYKNDDPFAPISNDEQITDDWKIEIDFLPQKPVLKPVDSYL